MIADGMRAERVRMDVIAENIANAEVTRTPEGGPYKRKEVVLQAAMPVPAFYLPPIVKFAVMPIALRKPQPAGIASVQIVTDNSPPRRVYDPGHPDADADGYVLLPNVDVPLEMIDLMVAARAYEANARALQVLRESMQRAIDLLR